MANVQQEFERRFAKHPVHNLLRELITQVEGGINSTSINEGANGRLYRLKTGFERAQRTLAATDKWLVGNQTLKELHRALAATRDPLNIFFATGGADEAQLNAANENLDNQVLPVLQRFPRPESPEEAAVLVEQTQEKFQEIAEEWEQKLSEWKRSADESAVEIHKALEATAALAEKIKVQDERLGKLVERSDAAISELNSKAAAAEAERAKAALDAESARAQRIEMVVADFQKRLTKEGEEFREAAGKLELGLKDEVHEILEKLREHERQASELLQLIGNKGITAPFKTTADADRRVAFWLRLAAAACFVGLVAVVIFVAIDVHIATTQGQGFDWGRVVFRVLTGLVLSVPAYYFAREAAKFQNESDRNRRVQLELASLGPFIEHLDPVKRDALKEELTRRYFGTPHVAPELERPIELKDLLGLLRIALRRK